jgi:two-component system, LytTR family, sensor kinase
MPANTSVHFPIAYEHEPLMANAIGYLAGAIVFGIFLALALRGGAGRRLRQSWLSVASAGLAFLWNAGSLAELLLPPGGANWTVSAANFACLSLLPAVLLHLSLNGRFRAISAAAYSVSAAATAMHLCEPMAPEQPLHEWALRAITYGFGGLTVAYAACVLRDGEAARRRTPQILASMCLLLFAVSFSHFEPEAQPWKELIVHHAGIPAALLILLQDYRFVFLDAFVQFLANVMLAATLAYGGISLGAALSPAGETRPLSGIYAVAGWSGLLILFAYLRGLLRRWLASAVFRGSGMESAIRQLRAKAGEMRDEREYLDWAAERVAAAARASRFAMLGGENAGAAALPGAIEYPALAGELPAMARDPEWNWAEAIVPIRLAREDVRYLVLGRRRGGMRYLSEDLRQLNYVAAVAAEEVERFRAAEMQRLVSEAELRALHSQINPHFLFNALNTIYGIIPREAAGARSTVLHLAEIFRYFLQSDKKTIPLSEELKIVRAYLEIEQLRLGPRLRVEIDVDAEAGRTLIPILSVQPLVENAIKHGLSARVEEGWLRLRARAADGALTVTVENSGTLAEAGAADRHQGAGVGLANVTRRLQLCYGPASGVTVRHGASGTLAEFSIPLAEAQARR